MSIETIARVLCRTKVHVKVLLFRARTRLVRELKQERKRDERGRTLEQFQPALATGEKAQTLLFADNYTLTGGGLTLTAASTIQVASGKAATITSPLTTIPQS